MEIQTINGLTEKDLRKRIEKLVVGIRQREKNYQFNKNYLKEGVFSKPMLELDNMRQELIKLKKDLKIIEEVKARHSSQA